MNEVRHILKSKDSGKTTNVLPIGKRNDIDLLLTTKRDKKAALRFFKKATGRNGKASLISMNKSSENKARINQFNKDNNKRIKLHLVM